MNGPLAIGLVLAVAALALLLRRGSVAPAATPPVESALDAETDAGSDDSEPGAPDEELAVTSEGAVFIPDGHSVRLMSLDPEEMAAHHEDIEAGLFALSREERLQLVARRGKPGQALSAGDFTAARIRRGAADVVPWALETLGRDGEYIPFPFETEDGARAALAMLERQRIIRRPLDEDGHPIPASPEDFEEARRRYEESWRALAMESDLEGGSGEGGIVSDRR